jgi:hypothetical protein
MCAEWHVNAALLKRPQAICEAALTIAENNPDVTIIFPVHLNPKVREVVFPMYVYVEGEGELFVREVSLVVFNEMAPLGQLACRICGPIP